MSNDPCSAFPESDHLNIEHNGEHVHYWEDKYLFASVRR